MAHWITWLGCLGGLAGAAGAAVSPTPREPVAVGEPFLLALGESVDVARTTIRVGFSSVEQDSRCPSGVTCVWAGNARIAVELRSTTAPSRRLELNTNSRFHRAAEYEGLIVTLLELEPYPESGVPRQPAAYRATLRVDVAPAPGPR
jgi:hypothetical protein